MCADSVPLLSSSYLDCAGRAANYVFIPHGGGVTPVAQTQGLLGCKSAAHGVTSHDDAVRFTWETTLGRVRVPWVYSLREL